MMHSTKDLDIASNVKNYTSWVGAAFNASFRAKKKIKPVTCSLNQRSSVVFPEVKCYGD